MGVRVQLPDVDGIEVEVIQKRFELLGISLPGATDHVHQMHADGIPGRVHPGGEPVGKTPALILDMHGAVEQRRLSGNLLSHGRRVLVQTLAVGVKEHLESLRRGYRPVNHASARFPEGVVEPGVVGGVAGIADVSLRELPRQLHRAAAVLNGKRREVVVNGVDQFLAFARKLNQILLRSFTNAATFWHELI